MDIIKNIADWIGVSDQQQTHHQYAETFHFGSISKETVSVEHALTNSIVLSAINLISDGIAQLPWNVQNIATGQINQKDIYKILVKPNDYQTPFEFKKACVVSLLQYGNAFIHVVKVNGKPQQLVLLDPMKVSSAPNTFGLPTYKYEGRTKLILADEMIHIKDIPDFSSTGKSRVALAADILGLHKGTSRFAGQMMSNSAQVSGVITFPGALDAVKRDSLKDAVSKFKSNGSESGNMIILADGATYDSFDSFSAADAELRAFRTMLTNEIAGVFRVPAFAIGGGGDEKYNNVSQKYASLYRDTYAPIITSFEESMSLKLVKASEQLKFDVSSLIKGDYTTQVANAEKLVATGIITSNEARAMLGYKPVDGGDDLNISSTTTTDIPGAQSTGGNGNE